MAIGRFSVEDARLLEKCIQSLQKLDDGRLKPKTALQVHFVSVCRGNAPPMTKYEKAYMGWRHSKPHIPGVIATAESNARVVMTVNKKKAARPKAKKRKDEYWQKLNKQQLSGPKAKRKSPSTRTAVYTYK